VAGSDQTMACASSSETLFDCDCVHVCVCVCVCVCAPCVCACVCVCVCVWGGGGQPVQFVHAGSVCCASRRENNIHQSDSENNSVTLDCQHQRTFARYISSIAPAYPRRTAPPAFDGRADAPTTMSDVLLAGVSDARPLLLVPSVDMLHRCVTISGSYGRKNMSDKNKKRVGQ
jgi:hypothetical protein